MDLVVVGLFVCCFCWVEKTDPVGKAVGCTVHTATQDKTVCFFCELAQHLRCWTAARFEIFGKFLCAFGNVPRGKHLGKKNQAFAYGLGFKYHTPGLFQVLFLFSGNGFHLYEINAHDGNVVNRG